MTPAERDSMIRLLVADRGIDDLLEDIADECARRGAEIRSHPEMAAKLEHRAAKWMGRYDLLMEIAVDIRHGHI